MRYWLHTSCLLVVALLSSSSALADNLGSFGALFTIVEQDLQAWIHTRLKQMQQNGQLEQLKQQFLRNVTAHTLRPVPVAGLSLTTNPRAFYYDPTYVLTRDITDHRQRLIAKAGTVINPLDTVKLSSIWLFFDADDARQVKWAKATAKQYYYTKYILVAGNVKLAGEALQDRIYFDQSGAITKQLRLEHIPCTVKQQGRRLQIQEFALT